MLKPQDVVLALYLTGAQPRTQGEIAGVIGLSQAEISNALKRLQAARLLLHDARGVIVPNLLEFCIHGVKYAYAPVVGRRRRGVPTAALVAPLRGHVSGEEGELVWPDSAGSVRAQSLEPIHPCVPHAAQQDARLHELMALVDGIRVGKSRMRKLAEEKLAARLEVGENKHEGGGVPA